MVDLFGKAAAGGSYFNKYLMSEDSVCVPVCVCLFSGGGVRLCMCG